MEKTTATAMEGRGSKALDFRKRRLGLTSSTHNINSPANGEKVQIEDLVPVGTMPLSKTLGTKDVDSQEIRWETEPLNNQKPQAPNTGSSSAKDYKVPTNSSSPNSLPPLSSNSPPQTPTHSTKPSEFGAHSPNTTQNPSPARMLQQIFQQELLRVESEERLEQEASPPLTGNSVPKNPKESEIEVFVPSILHNANGVPYLDGDLNRGYPVDATLPRLSKTHPALPIQTQGASSSIHRDGSEATPQPNQSNSLPANRGKPKNWASIFKSQSPTMDVKLEYFPELHRGRNAEVEIDEDLTEVDSWDKYLVGYFLDGKMPFPLLLSTARNAWKDRLVSLKVDASGFIVFQFRDEQAKQSVLDEGPWFFSRKYLVLKN